MRKNTENWSGFLPIFSLFNHFLRFTALTPSVVAPILIQLLYSTMLYHHKYTLSISFLQNNFFSFLFFYFFFFVFEELWSREEVDDTVRHSWGSLSMGCSCPLFTGGDGGFFDVRRLCLVCVPLQMKWRKMIIMDFEMQSRADDCCNRWTALDSLQFISQAWNQLQWANLDLVKRWSASQIPVETVVCEADHLPPGAYCNCFDAWLISFQL